MMRSEEYYKQIGLIKPHAHAFSRWASIRQDAQMPNACIRQEKEPQMKLF